MDGECFNSVVWPDLHNGMSNKPNMYRLCGLTSRAPGIVEYGTKDTLNRQDKSECTNCPNCGRFEDADHFNKYGNKARQQLLGDNIEKVRVWLEETPHQFTWWIPMYLR